MYHETHTHACLAITLSLTLSLSLSLSLSHTHTHTQLAMIVEPLIDHNMLYSGWKPSNNFQTWTSYADSVGMKPFEPQVFMRVWTDCLSLSVGACTHSVGTYTHVLGRNVNMHANPHALSRLYDVHMFVHTHICTHARTYANTGRVGVQFAHCMDTRSPYQSARVHESRWSGRRWTMHLKI